MNKKGTIQDIFYVVVISLVTIITVMMSITIYNSQLRTSDIYSSADSPIEIRDDYDRLDRSWDGIFFMFIFIALLTPIVAGFLVGSHPAFMWVAILMGIFVVLFGVIMNNVYDKMINEDSLNQAKVKLPRVTFIFDNMGKILTIFIAMLMIALYSGVKLGQGQG